MVLAKTHPLRAATRRLHQFATLPGTKRILLLRAMFWLAAMRIALAVMPLGMLLRWLDAATARPECGEPDEFAWAIEVIAPRLPGSTCLVRALALRAMLRGTEDCHVRIGVRPPGHGPLEAHAWVEWRGRVLGSRPREGQAYLPLRSMT